LWQRWQLYLHRHTHANRAAMMRAHLHAASLASSIVMRHGLVAMKCWIGVMLVTGSAIERSPTVASQELEQQGQDQSPKCAVHTVII
jgi:hypothetical protein